MKTATAIVAMLACAAVGAGATGWIMASNPDIAALASRRSPPLPEMPSEARRRAATPTGDIAGAPAAHVPLNWPNPYGNDPSAIEEGHRLFMQMNCAGCHNYGGIGGMGPNLTDPHWGFGGTPSAIYKTISEGRPKGMPAWGRSLPPETLWKLTAYVHSLGGGVPPDMAQAELQGDFVPAQRATEDKKGDMAHVEAEGQ
jgi:cytochrome c oxidase cbb3-type subunit 3